VCSHILPPKVAKRCFRSTNAATIRAISSPEKTLALNECTPEIMYRNQVAIIPAPGSDPAQGRRAVMFDLYLVLGDSMTIDHYAAEDAHQRGLTEREDIGSASLLFRNDSHLFPEIEGNE